MGDGSGGRPHLQPGGGRPPHRHHQAEEGQGGNREGWQVVPAPAGLQLAGKDPLHAEEVGGGTAGLADGDQVCGVRQASCILPPALPVLPARQMEGGDGDAGEMLWLGLNCCN